MRIHLPNSAFLGNIDAFLQGFDPASPETLEVTANQKWISIHPAVLSMVAALGLTVPGRVRIEKLEAKSAHYIARMGLFTTLNVPCNFTMKEHAPEGRFIPITQIRTSDELTHFITDMIPLLHQEPEQAKTIGYIVSELVRNVLEHSQSENGALLCAQYYAKTNRICIGIADTGVGIKKTITRSHTARTDLEAIRLALSLGITGTTPIPGGTDQNAGAGLFFIKAIADVNRDFFVIYSGHGFFKLLKKTSERLRLNADPFNDRHAQSNVLPYWNGTVVGVDITLEQTREFSILLDAIRKTYFDMNKPQRPERKKPRFV